MAMFLAKPEDFPVRMLDDAVMALQSKQVG